MKTDEKQQKNLSINFILNPKPTDGSHTSKPIVLNNFIFQEFFKTIKGSQKLTFFSTESFYLIYCFMGEIILLHQGKSRHIKCQQSCMVYDPCGSGINISISGPSIRFFAIGFKKADLTALDDANYFGNLKDVFANIIKENIYLGSINLEIFEKINTLTRLPRKTVADKFIIEGFLFQIFGLKTIQILEERQRQDYMGSGFTSFEMEQLVAVSQYITENPAEEYTIQSLCKKTGLGPNKLQRGFRKMHQKTVIDYIRHRRLEKALQLLKKSNLTISEIVYCVGFSSRSYFSKIFKMKYKCSPKNYQKSIATKTA